ncbi:MAG: CPBP family intramembrane metalloprotease [Candidatus Heimdallarchaeota archaeon]|nr:CPBP family intramembrane metalloprotease [Candidatus Heimdallarchaeota archaeon]
MTRINTTTKELLRYYIIAFAFSWAIWVPQALYNQGLLAYNSYIAFFEANPVGAFGPLVSALLLSLLRKEGRELLKNGFRRNFAKRWYIVSITLLPVMFSVAIGIAMLKDGFAPEFMGATNPAMLIIVPIWIFVYGGPIQEEFGWRGYAMPRWMEKYNSLTAGTITGFLWGFWHLPLFYIAREDMYYNKPMLGLFLSTMMLSVIMVWIYNHTNQSLLPMLLFHTAFNSSHALIPVLEHDTSSFWHMVFMAAVCILIVLKDGVDLGRRSELS